VAHPDGRHGARAAAAGVRPRLGHRHDGVGDGRAEDRGPRLPARQGRRRATDRGDPGDPRGRDMTTPATEPDGQGTTAEETSWHRLDPRLILLNLSFLVPPVLAFGGTALVAGGVVPGRVYPGLISVTSVLALLMLRGLLRYATTRYRITAERVELHTGLLQRRYLSIPRDRIRSVDLTANPMHRVFGLSVVKVGTGQAGGGLDTTELALDAITRQRADEIRRELLDRTPPPARAPQEAASTEPEPAPAPSDDGEPI